VPRKPSLTPAQRAALDAGRTSAPPAPLGNTRTRRHGGWASIAADRLDSTQREIFDALAADAPLRDNAGELPRHDSVAVHELAVAMCRLDDVRAHLRDTGWIDQATGEPRTAVLAVEDRLSTRVSRLLDALGMTPKARAALGLDLARTLDLSSVLSDPDPERRAAGLAAAGLLDDDVIDGEASS